MAAFKGVGGGDQGRRDWIWPSVDESISRSAGAAHGREKTPQEMELIILATGRRPRQRTTLYGDADAGLRQRSFDSAAARMSGNQEAMADSATYA
jgi:FO synthase